MYANLNLNEIRAKLNISSIFFIVKSKSQKLEIKMFVKRKNFKNWKKVFCIRLRTLLLFWDQKLNLATFEGGGCIGTTQSLFQKINSYCFYVTRNIHLTSPNIYGLKRNEQITTFYSIKHCIYNIHFYLQYNTQRTRFRIIVHTEKSIMNLVNSNQIWLVITHFQ